MSITINGYETAICYNGEIYNTDELIPVCHGRCGELIYVIEFGGHDRCTVLPAQLNQTVVFLHIRGGVAVNLVAEFHDEGIHVLRMCPGALGQFQRKSLPRMNLRLLSDLLHQSSLRMG